VIDLTNPFPRRPAAFARLPRLIRLYIVNCTCGFLLAAVFTGGLLLSNTAGLGHLVTTVDGGWLAAFILFMANGIVFAGVQTAIVVWAMRDHED